MVGTAPEDASPIILFCCEKSAHRKEVQKVVKESRILDLYPGIKTGHARRAPGFDQLVPLAGGGGACTSDWRIFAFPDHYGSPCGMRLSLEPLSGGEAQRRQATVGGVIQLRERFYYTTAAHVFCSSGTSHQDQVDYSESEGETEFDSDDDMDPDSDGDGASSPADPPWSDDLPKWLTDTETSLVRVNDGPRMCEQSERAEKAAEDEKAAEKKEAAADYEGPTDLDPEYPGATKPEDGEERHQSLTSKDALEEPAYHGQLQLKQVSLSSLDEPPSDLDYSLIEVSHADHQTANECRLPPGSDQERITIRSISAEGTRDAKIISITPRGALAGSLSGTPTYARSPRAGAFQELYTARLGHRLQAGDCGSWVVDAESGDLFGHVVAGSPASGAAVVVPAAAVVRDIGERGGDVPRFPA